MTRRRGNLTVIHRATEFRELVWRCRAAGTTTGLVPTMGAVHAGHLSLVAASRGRCGFTGATIFVNPTQFGPGEDLAAYPRTLEQDLEALERAGVDAVFVPEESEMYPAGSSTVVLPPEVGRRWEGEWRPSHFRGVCTIVLKLFQAAPADIAFFGQKDYQQALVIRHMARDLLAPIEVVTCPIVREADGLALSSRNVYLSPDARQRALGLSRALRDAGDLIGGGERSARRLEAQLHATLRQSGVDEIDYAVVVDPETLAPLDTVGDSAVALIAARVAGTRLIDNVVWTCGPAAPR